jgi:hypothetical protein
VNMGAEVSESLQLKLLSSIEGGSHVTLTGHARAGMGHRS